MLLSRFTCLLLVLLLSAFATGQGVNTGGGGINTGGNFGGGGLGGAGGGGGGGLNGFGGVGQNGGRGGGGATGSISGLFNDNSDIQGTGFLGRNANTGGFLTGAGTGAAQNGQFGNAGGFGGRGAGGGGAAGRGGGQQQQGQQSTRVVRTRITIPRDFGRVIVPPSRIRSNLNLEYRRVSRLKRVLGGDQSRVTTGGLRGSSVTATPSGESVILSGSVASERDRIIAEKMAKMEPGVRSVINQLVVSPQ